MLALEQAPVRVVRARTVNTFKVQLQFFERDHMMTAMDSNSLTRKGFCSLLFVCKIGILLLLVIVGRCTWKCLCVSENYACCYQEFQGRWRCEGV